MIYFIILAVLILLCYRYDILCKKKDVNLWYRLMLLVFILLAGLRWRVGGDTPNYLYEYYYLTPDILHCTYEDFYRREPLFSLLNIIPKSIGCKFFVVQLIQALIVNTLIFKYIKRATAYPFAGLILYFFWIYVFLNFEEMRAGISVAISLYANDYVINGKRGKGLLLYILAALFHYSAILLIFTPVLTFLKIDGKIVLVLIASFLIGYAVQLSMGDYLFLFEVDDQIQRRMQYYTESDVFFSQGLNWKGFLGRKFPYIFYVLFSFYYIKKHSDNSKAQGLLKYQPFVVLGLMWLMISTPVPLCSRYTRFYEIYFILFFSYSFIELIKRNGSLTKRLAFARAFLLYLPFFYLIGSGYFSMQTVMVPTPFVTYRKYIPYRSIFNKVDNREFEKQCDWNTKARSSEY